MFDVAGFSKHQGTPASLKALIKTKADRIVRFPDLSAAKSRSPKGFFGFVTPHGWALVRITLVRLRAMLNEVHGVASMDAIKRRSLASRQSLRRFDLLHKSNSGPRSIS